MKGGNGLNINMPNYISLRWFFSGIGDGFNPSSPPIN
jgi:hypothetical protein